MSSDVYHNALCVRIATKIVIKVKSEKRKEKNFMSRRMGYKAYMKGSFVHIRQISIKKK